MVVKKYACNNCGLPYEAYPPDDVFTMAKTTKCWICSANYLTIVTRSIECGNCDHRNTIYWHKPIEHDLIEIKTARINRDKQDILADLLHKRSNRISK